MYKNSEVRRIFSLTQLDLKFILLAGFINYAVMSINLFLFFGYQILILIFNFNRSFYVWTVKQCLFSQGIFTTISPQIGILLIFAMFLERLYISIGFKSNGTFGFLLSFFSVVLVSFFQYSIANSKTYEKERVFCGGGQIALNSKVFSNTFFLIIFDFTITIFDFLLLLVNKWKIRSYK